MPCLPVRTAGVRLQSGNTKVQRPRDDLSSRPGAGLLIYAGLLGRRLRLTRLDLPWATALRLSLAVLSESEFVGVSKGLKDVQAFELSVETDKLWERVVTTALARSDFDVVMQPGHRPFGLTEDPWADGPHIVSLTRPDNIAYRHPELWVIDAKYKRPATSSPSRSDQYQMFAYSHLVRDVRQGVRGVVLVYPNLTTERRWRRGRDASLRPVELFTVGVTYPSPQDVLSAYAWDAYLDRAADEVTTSLRDTAALSGAVAAS